MFWNMVTGAVIGTATGAIAWALTSRHHAGDGTD
jgi:uncharacterized membrane protein